MGSLLSDCATAKGAFCNYWSTYDGWSIGAMFKIDTVTAGQCYGFCAPLLKQCVSFYGQKLSVAPKAYFSYYYANNPTNKKPVPCTTVSSALLKWQNNNYGYYGGAPYSWGYYASYGGVSKQTFWWHFQHGPHAPKLEVGNQVDIWFTSSKNGNQLSQGIIFNGGTLLWSSATIPIMLGISLLISAG